MTRPVSFHGRGKVLTDEDLADFFDVMSDTVVVLNCRDDQPETGESKIKRNKDPDIEAAQQACRTEDDDLSEGTGVVIQPGYILTAAHVVRNCSDISYYHFDQNTVWKADVVKIDADIDLALLKRRSNVGSKKFAKLAENGSVTIGQQVLSIGHPTGNNYTFALGNVAYPNRYMFYESDDPTKHACMLIQINNLHSRPGASGGPLFNNKGLVIGICVRDHTVYDMAVHINQIRHFLQDTYIQMEY